MTKGVVAAGIGLIFAAVLVSSFISRQHLGAAEKRHTASAIAQPVAPAPEVKSVPTAPPSEIAVQKTAEAVPATEPPPIAKISAKETLNGPVRVLWEAGKYGQALALVDQVLISEPANGEARSWKKKIREAQAAEAALK